MKPACPLATVLYRFDDPTRFPVFESNTTAKGLACVHLERDDEGVFLRISYQRHSTDVGEVAIVLALPIVGVEGRPRKLLLNVLGDASRTHLYVEGMDGHGELVVFSFGSLDFEGWRTLRADASIIVPPLQFHRLRANTAAASVPVRLGLRSLSLTGDVRITASGVA